MSFNLIPTPAFEELAMGYVPYAVGRRSIGEVIFFGAIAAAYLMALLVMFQFPSADPSRDAQSGAAASVTFAEVSCGDCARKSPTPSARKRIDHDTSPIAPL